MILSCHTLRKIRPVEPFEERGVFLGLSYGLSVAGYDVRVEFDPEGKVPIREVLPGKLVLASTIEKFNMPNAVLGIVHDKSTWIRKGLAVQNTVIEPSWCGHLTLEITNHSDNSILLKRGHPIAQIIFHWVDRETDGYEGKYKNQPRGPQMSLFEDE